MNEWMNDDDDDDDDGLNFTVWGIFIKDFHLTLWIISLDFIDGPANSRKFRSFHIFFNFRNFRNFGQESLATPWLQIL